MFLETVKPSIFAKGGDRTPESLPKSEVEVCGKLGIKSFLCGRRKNSKQQLENTEFS